MVIGRRDIFLPWEQTDKAKILFEEALNFVPSLAEVTEDEILYDNFFSYWKDLVA